MTKSSLVRGGDRTPTVILSLDSDIVVRLDQGYRQTAEAVSRR